MDNTNRQSESSFPASIAVLVAFATLQAIEVNFGHLHPIGLAWIIVAMVLLVGGMRREPRGVFARLTKLPVKWAAIGCVTIQWVQLAMWGVSANVDVHLPFAWFAIAILIAGVGAVVAFLRTDLRRLGLTMLLVAHAAAAAYVIRSTPNPFCDAWYFQQESAGAILRGANPYEVRYRNIYAPDTSIYSNGICVDGWLTVSNPYPPATLLVDACGKAFGDVRWAHLACFELSAICLVLVSKQFGAIGAAMLLVSPATMVVLQWGWTEPTVILGFAMVMYYAARWREKLWIAVGFLIASKQYGPIFLPLLMLMGLKMRRREIASVMVRAMALACVITLPFVIWNPTAFFRSVILWQMQQPFRMDCLSFRALVASLTGYQMPPIVGFILGGVAMVWARRNVTPGLSAFAAASGFVLLWFFSFGQQAHYNYYVLVIAAASAAVASADVRVEAIGSHADQSPRDVRLAA